MGKINLLSSKIYNRIAAGEVVERPASVVKELVENSIDAGATNISVKVYDGGISKIIVSDNGSGIEKSDLKKCLLPHATSKISKISDLDNICYLGFRGEALASISSVSKIKIVSKIKEDEFGNEIYSEGGEIGFVSECGAINGTEITVSNLFYNTPAREKFLKTPRSEECEITTVISRFILSNPDISFTYYADDKIVYQSFGDGIVSSIICIYGKDIIDNCYYIDTVKNGIEIKGYIGKPFFSKPNRTYGSFFLNGRFIVNSTVSASIQNAYSSYLMKRQYPFYVLSVKVPTETVDVNVHPNKIDVRFTDNQIIYGTLYSVISKTLDGLSEAVSIISNMPNNKENTTDFNANYVKHNDIINDNKINIKESPNEKYKFDKLVFQDINNSENINKKPDNTIDIFAENKAYIEKLEREKIQKSVSQKENYSIEEMKIDKQLNYIGQALNTYLIFDDGDDLFLIDQHAAHERIKFDYFINQLNSNEVDIQPLLLPFILKTNQTEYQFVLSKLEILQQMGFDISEFSDFTFKISSIPLILSEINLSKFFNDLLSDLNSLKEISIVSLLKEKIAQKACKSAIKAGDKLSENDIKSILEQLKGNLGLKCPHGRPICIKITNYEIEKWFKRIV